MSVTLLKKPHGVPGLHEVFLNRRISEDQSQQEQKRGGKNGQHDYNHQADCQTNHAKHQADCGPNDAEDQPEDSADDPEY